LKRRVLAAAAVMVLAACSGQRDAAPASATLHLSDQMTPSTALSMNEIATGYVRLVLALGELDPGYVDAYYGPPEWREQAKARHLGAAQIEEQAQQLLERLQKLAPEPLPQDPELPALRKAYLRNQLGALSARAEMLQGHKFIFDDEARALYDVDPPHYSERDFEPHLKALEKLLPGPGSLADRYNHYLERFAIPRDKLQGVMQSAIDYARQRVRAHIELPPGERFDLALVENKPWSAYNWYQGGYYSRIEVNTDQLISISRVIQLASHEGYPGHHVYNSLLEQQLVRGQGWPEYQVYPLFSPQSLIAEGSADFGVDLTFAGQARLDFERELFRWSGFDTRQLQTYDRVAQAAKALRPAAIEAARRYLDGRASADATVAWLQHYTLASEQSARQRVQFFDQYRSYIVNYSYGEELVARAVAARGGGQAGDPLGSGGQWRAFVRLLSTPRVPSTLLPAPAP
jgi:hypothetical protein